MLDPAIGTKVSDFFQTSILNCLEDLHAQLMAGKLWQVESTLCELSQELHNTILEELLPSAAQVFSANHQAPKGVKMQQRTHSIRISTGKQIAVDSPYYKYRPFDCSEARRPLLEHWQAIDGMSPLLMDRVGFMSMLAPSYELACQSVNKFGVEICLSSVQKITTRLAHHCDELGHENIVVKEC